MSESTTSQRETTDQRPSSAGAGAQQPTASASVAPQLRGMAFAEQEAFLAPVQRKGSGGAAVQARASASVGRNGVAMRGSVNLPSTDVAYAAYPGFTTKWTLSGGCGWKVSLHTAAPEPENALEITATGGPVEFGGDAPGGGAHASGPEVSNQINLQEVEVAVKQEVLDGLFELGGDVDVSRHGVGGGLGVSCNPGTIQLGNGVILRVPALDLKIADYDAETGELSVCQLETKFPITGAEFTLRQQYFDIKITPHLELKFKLQPNWFTIAEQLGIQLSADAGVGEAAVAVAANVGIDLLGFIAAPAAAAAMLGVAAHEFEAGDELVDAANATGSHVYTYCSAYARSWMSGRPSNGPGGRAAGRDMEAARQANPGIQIRDEARLQGEESIYRRVFELVRDPAIEALKARIRQARFLRGSEEITIAERVDQARWGGLIWRRHGGIPAPRAASNQPDADSEGGGASPGVDANAFDPELARLSARGVEMAAIHRRERAMLSHLNRFKESALVSERHGDGASAALDELVNYYRDRYIPKVLALRAAYRQLRVSEDDWKVHPHFTARREYDPDLNWAKSMADATVGVPHPHDPRLAAIDGFIRQLHA